VTRTLVLTDSNVCLPHSLTRRLGIRLVPITILLGDTVVPDNSIDPERVFAALARDDTVKSSPPSVFDYLGEIERDNPDAPVIVLTPAAEFTSMHLHASEASELATRDVRVVDTRTAAAAQRLVVLEVARAAQRDTPVDRLETLARDLVGRTELVAILDHVTTIERSGHVPSPVLAEAQRAGGFSAFRFHDGTVVPLSPDAETGLDLLEGAWIGDGGPAAPASAVFHAGARAQADELRARLGIDDPVIPFSAAMAIHTGPGVVGVAWLRPETAQPSR
jgi:fatty acid-binding protein DegV